MRKDTRDDMRMPPQDIRRLRKLRVSRCIVIDVGRRSQATYRKFMHIWCTKYTNLIFLICQSTGYYRNHIWPLTHPNPKYTHNIIQTHNNVLWDWQYYAKYFHIQTKSREYYVYYCWSHKILLLFWITLCTLPKSQN